ncbi:MAG: SUMF1/EgtB/PvdO family nonheme iron enzyme [Nitrospinae bacterium]|nr:SUMF1/EgtB/PvdO family nonheme iron enzyme [Nitrospinota bacterium]
MKKPCISMGILMIPMIFFFLPILSACISADSKEEEATEVILGKMIFIPEGEFTMGSDDPELRGYFDIWGGKARFQKPVGTARKVHVKGFYIDSHEVTQGQYKKFIDDTHYPPPSYWENGTFPAGKENHPVHSVSWSDARAYARWAGKRLPTEEEWEKAARGGDLRVFPWGNQPEGAMAQLWKTAWGKTEGPQPIGKFKFDKSPYGVRDMASNLMEWTASTYEYQGVVTQGRAWEESSSGTEIVVKGGNWSSEMADGMISRKILAPPGEISNGIGFRCVKDAK